MLQIIYIRHKALEVGGWLVGWLSGRRRRSTTFLDFVSPVTKVKLQKFSYSAGDALMVSELLKFEF